MKDIIKSPVKHSPKQETLVKYGISYFIEINFIINYYHSHKEHFLRFFEHFTCIYNLFQFWCDLHIPHLTHSSEQVEHVILYLNLIYSVFFNFLFFYFLFFNVYSRDRNRNRKWKHPTPFFLLSLLSCSLFCSHLSFRLLFLLRFLLNSRLFSSCLSLLVSHLLNYVFVLLQNVFVLFVTVQRKSFRLFSF